MSIWTRYGVIMIAMPNNTEIDGRRTVVSACWSLGKYDELAQHLMPAAEAVAAAAGNGDGRRAIDVAAGNGNAAVALAARGWRVVATDLAPRMIELGTERTSGLDVGWREADLADLPFDARTFDLAVSTFGVIFAPEPAAAVAEARRVLRSGGRLILTAWTADGEMARMTAAMSPWLPAGGPDPFAWGDPATVRSWLGADFANVEITEQALPWRFDSARAGRDFLASRSPAHVAAQQHAGHRSDEMMDALERHVERLAGLGGRVDTVAEYLLITAS
jgi:SAM-dependent methyltransferase